jgi:multiple sugar transport system permease protein
MRREEGRHDDLDFFSALSDAESIRKHSDARDAAVDKLIRATGDPAGPSDTPVRALSAREVYFTSDPEDAEKMSDMKPEPARSIPDLPETESVKDELESDASFGAENTATFAGTARESSDEAEASVFDELNEKAQGKHRVWRFAKANRTRIVNKFVVGVFFTIVLFASVLALLPIVLTILNSFMSSEEIQHHYGAIYQSLSGYTGNKAGFVAEPKLRFIPDMVSVDQYATLLVKTPAYLLKFWNSVLIVVPIVIGQMAVGSLAAFAFARYRKKWSEALFFAYIILMLMPHQVTLVPNLFIADSLGILDSWWAIILPGVFSTFSVFLLSKYMRQIPASYIEAAKLDGAGEWHIFYAICIPMCKSALYAMSILLFIDYWNMVEQPLLMLKNTDLYPMSVFLSQINQKELGVAFAASTIFMIPPLLMFFNGEEYLVEGISRSGIK